MVTSRFTKTIAGALLACSLLLSACSGSQEKEPAKPAPTTEAAKPTEAPKATETPKESESPKAAEGDTMEVTDVAGRTVELPKHVERMIFGESRLVYASAILNKENPIEGVVAWGTDLQSNAPDIYAKLLETTPAAKDLPKTGSIHKGDVDIEALLALKPQVMFISLDMEKAGKENGVLQKFEDAGIPYLVTDFRQDPVKNTETTVEMLGKVMGKEDKAKEFIDFYKGVVDPISAKAPELLAKAPTTFIWRAPGLLPCCSTFADSNFGKILVASGGNNLADKVAPNEEGILTPEAVINAQPAQLIATGGDWAAKKLNKEAKVGFLPMGYTIDKATAQKGLAELMKQPGFSELKAKGGAIHGVYHQLYDSPWNFAAFQQFAKWSNPDAFKDVDVDKTWNEFHEKFLPWKSSGTFFISLDK